MMMEIPLNLKVVKIQIPIACIYIVLYDYKVSTWIMTNELVNGRYYKDLKAYQVGTQNNKNAIPDSDAKQYYAPGDEEARFMYPQK